MVMSLAVTVGFPAVLSVRLKLRVPPTSGALAGSAALTSLELIATESLVLTRFQLASTAFTVTLKEVPAVWALGVPVRPVAVPGAAVWPGTSNCSLAKEPAFTVIAGLVLAVLVASLRSLAVTVRAPDALKVMLKVCSPEARDAEDGRSALGSDEAIPTVSFTLVKMFQLASTAATVMLKGTAAVCGVGVPFLPVLLP